MSTEPSADPRTGRLQPLFLAVLALAVLLDLLLRGRIIYHYIHSEYPHSFVLDLSRNIFMTLFFGLLFLFLCLLVRLLLSGRQRLICGVPGGDHRRLKPLAVVVTAMTFVNLVSENLAIYRLNLASYSLLMESFCLYLSITLVFLFWYWYVDQAPPQLGSSLYGVVFPEELIESARHDTLNWKPVFMDYVYFTILSSNCFGPPEGHLLVGQSVKRLHVMHSVCMISVFIVILARAVNTLR